MQPQPGPAVVNPLQPQGIPTADGDEVKILPLGSGGEVGRSCVIASYKDKHVMFDCGSHPAKTGLDALPFFDKFDMANVDLLLITHFHLDHCAGLPYLVTQTNFKGRIFMTSATKAFYKHVMADFLRIGNAVSDIVNSEWIRVTLDRIETIEYHEEKTWAGIRFSPFNAGHVLGAAMFMVDIAGVKILYTGDYSTVADRHLMGAEIPPISPDILIVEATYGRQVHESREEREEKFITWVTEVVRRGGRCLIPLFALGRAQELLLILEEHWRQNKDLQHVKIFYASNLAQRCMNLYQRYVHSMNELVKQQQEKYSTNPFDFKFISPLQSLREFDDSGPSIVIAAPGMLQNGLSLELFERWCSDPRNGVVFAGYCVDGTLAMEVMQRPKEVVTSEGKLLRVRMGTIQTVSFSAHSDARQTSNFIGALKDVRNVVLVHGNEDAIAKLQQKLTEDFKALRDISIHKTKNLDTISIGIASQLTAKVLGLLATNTTKLSVVDEEQRVVLDGQRVNGILLLSSDHKHVIVHPDDVATFTGLDHATLAQAIILPLPTYRSAHDILAIMRTYFAGTEHYASIESARVATSADAGANGVPTAEDGEEVLLLGHGIAAMETSKGASGEEEETEAAAGSMREKEGPKGVLLKLRVDPANGHSVATITWRSSRLSDLIADVVCVALCNLVGSTSAASTAASSAGSLGETQPLPMQVADNVDRHFQLKCFHQMLSQFFPSVSTNLATGECRMVANDGERILVKDCIEIYPDTLPGVTPNLETNETMINGVTRANFEALGTVLKRLYLTLVPVPADFGWCDCGHHAYADSHIAYAQGLGAE